MTKIKHSLKQKMEQLKVWQEEAKLCLLIVAAISAVAVFVTNLWHGKVAAAPALGDVTEGIKGLGTGGGGIGLNPSLSLATIPQPLAHHHIPVFMYANLAVIILLGAFVVYFGIVVMKKWRTKK